MNEMINPFELKFQRSPDGLNANTRGKIVGTLLGRACGAERAGDENDNLWAIDGASVRFHSLSGGKSAFTLNAATEPRRLIVALTLAKSEGNNPLRYWLYGLTLAACTQARQASKKQVGAGPSDCIGRPDSGQDRTQLCRSSGAIHRNYDGARPGCRTQPDRPNDAGGTDNDHGRDDEGEGPGLRFGRTRASGAGNCFGSFNASQGGGADRQADTWRIGSAGHGIGAGCGAGASGAGQRA